jgi:HPt (histidine-containing phosphotransfer) domain-containing protein
MPEAALLDQAHLARQTFGDEALEREILGLFDHQCERLLPAIAGAGLGRDDAVHTLKGAARAVGAWRVACCAEAFETALARGAPAGTARRLRGELEAAIGDTRAALAPRLAEPR